jgi:hypothetical protein
MTGEGLFEKVRLLTEAALRWFADMKFAFVVRYGVIRGRKAMDSSHFTCQRTKDLD